MEIFEHRTRARRLQNQWLQRLNKLYLKSGVLDLGGDRNAEYLQILGLPASDVVIWNAAPETEPDAVVDLERVDQLPKFPKGCSAVFAFNLLEHLYRPLDLMEWVCKSLPKGGCFVILTPFCYPIHPSPNDYWRLCPQAYEKFFKELQERHGIQGDLSVEPLAEDLRDGVSIFTNPLFGGSKTRKLLGSSVEAALGWGSAVFGGDRLRAWAQKNPLSIGVFWVKK
jgi:hypothetical protein